MGVITKKLARVDFKDNGNKYFEFEMNKSDKVHIQNDAFRMEMKPEEFTQFATNIINGANKLIGYKGIEIDG